MKGSTLFWPIQVGVIVGVFYFPLFLSWLRRFLIVIGKPVAFGKSGVVAERSKLGMFVAAIHPAPWLLLIGVPYGFIHVHGHPAQDQWVWFIVSALITCIGLYLLAVLLMRRNRRRAASAARAKANANEHVT